MEQLISHFHEFRKEFLAQCEIFRIQIQKSTDLSHRNQAEIESIQKDIHAMQAELDRIFRSMTHKKRKTTVQILTDPLVLFAALAALLIFLISDLNVQKKDGILGRVVEAVPGIEKKSGAE